MVVKWFDVVTKLPRIEPRVHPWLEQPAHYVTNHQVHIENCESTVNVAMSIP